MGGSHPFSHVLCWLGQRTEQRPWPAGVELAYLRTREEPPRKRVVAKQRAGQGSNGVARAGQKIRGPCRTLRRRIKLTTKVETKTRIQDWGPEPRTGWYCLCERLARRSYDRIRVCVMSPSCRCRPFRSRARVGCYFAAIRRLVLLVWKS